MFPKGCRMNILIPFGLCCLACSGCATPEPHNDKITTLEPHTDKIMRVYFYQNDEPQIGEYRSCGADNGPMLLLNCTSRGSVVPTTSLKAFEQGLSNRNGVPLTLPVRLIGTPLYWSDSSPNLATFRFGTANAPMTLTRFWFATILSAVKAHG